MREGVLNCAGDENINEDSLECCKRCQAGTFNHEAKNSSTNFKDASPSVSLMFMTSLGIVIGDTQCSNTITENISCVILVIYIDVGILERGNMFNVIY